METSLPRANQNCMAATSYAACAGSCCRSVGETPTRQLAGRRRLLPFSRLGASREAAGTQRRQVWCQGCQTAGSILLDPLQQRTISRLRRRRVAGLEGLAELVVSLGGFHGIALPMMRTVERDLVDVRLQHAVVLLRGGQT